MAHQTLRITASFAVLVFALLTHQNQARADDAALGVEQVEAGVAGIMERGLWDGETGAWRTRSQLVADPLTHRLLRKTFTIWDPAPSRMREFTWVPEIAAGADEIVSGRGRLIWRCRDLPSYDTGSIVSIYQGEMQNGRPSGQGDYADVRNVVYSGEWVDGRAQGAGRLKLPNGDEYEGVFFGGRPHGQGHYVDATGEVYEGAFVEGRREGRATTTLPSAVSYQSEWRGGVELPSSRYVRLAQAGGAPSGGQAGDEIRIGILVNPVSPRMFKADGGAKEYAERSLGYTSKNTDKGLEIRPSNQRLLGMWKGNTEIQLTPLEEGVDPSLLPEVSYGVFSYSKTLLPPVDITVEVQNRATAPIQITGGFLDVAQSVTDRQPAVQVSVGNENECVAVRYHEYYSPKIIFENFGWGRVQNAKIRYAFIDPTAARIPQDLGRSRFIGTIEKTAPLSFESDLRASKADTAKLARLSACEANGRVPCNAGFKCTSKDKDDKLDEKACLLQIGGNSVFGNLADKVRISGLGDDGYQDQGNIVTVVAGQLEYEWADSMGVVHNRASPFRARLWLGRINAGRECGDGSSVKRVARSPLELKLDQSGYRVAIPIKESVPAGRVARYSMFLNAARASQHDFVIALQLADGRTIRSRPINLLYFYPSWYADQKSGP
jgi:hypothetical protein